MTILESSATPTEITDPANGETSSLRVGNSGVGNEQHVG